MTPEESLEKKMREKSYPGKVVMLTPEEMGILQKKKSTLYRNILDNICLTSSGTPFSIIERKL